MIKRASRRAAVVLAGSALTLAAGMIPAQAATTGWRIDMTVAAARGSAILFNSVAASSPSDAWATGLVGKTSGDSLPRAYIRRWNGKAWRPVALPSKVATAWAKTAPVVSVVGAASARNAWVFGSFTGRYLQLNGSRWSIGRLPGASSRVLTIVDAVKVFSSTDVWAFGVREVASGPLEPYAVHYNGHMWSRVTPPGSGGITAVAAASSHDIWAVESAQSSSALLGAANPAVARAVAASPAARSAAARLRAAGSAATPSVILQWTKAGWQDAPQQPSHLAASDQLVSGAAEPNGDVWFGGSGNNSAKGISPLTAEWNGTSWSVSDLPGKASSADWQLFSMAPDGTGGIWALALNANSNSALERIWHLHGTTWSQVQPAFGKHPWLLEGLALAPRTHSVWAVGAVEGSTTRSSVDGLIAINGSLPR